MSDEVPPRPDPDGAPERAPLPPATWSPLEAIPVFFVSVLLALVLGVVAALAFRGCSPRFVAATLAGELSFGVVVLGWVRWVDRAPLGALGAPRRPLVDAALGIVAGAALVLVGGLVLALDRAVATQILGHTPKDPQQVVSCVRGSGLLWLGPAVVLAAPFGEELLFRGYLYRGLRRRWRVWSSMLISGVAFGAVHFGGLDFLLLIPALVVVGMGLALVFERRQSILASMAAHATFNLIGFLSIAASRR